jgi:3-oxoisoapionate kinase
MGIGSKGAIYRLDRHPSMSRHPVTPADESDLRLHLEKQTAKKTGLIDILQIAASKKAIKQEIELQVQQGMDVVLFDALYQEQLLAIGEIIDDYAGRGPLFSVGSSGIEMALGQYWNHTNTLQPVKEWPHAGKAAPMLVICGSCSPVTAAQIIYAKANGFEELSLDAVAICNNDNHLVSAAVLKAADWLRLGKSVIIHTGGAANRQPFYLPADKLGKALGLIARQAVAQTAVKRVVIAGGDTSSYAARAMCIESVQMIAALVPGAPLCRATAPGSPLDGLEVNFKGGQVGGEDYFEILRNGELNT